MSLGRHANEMPSYDSVPPEAPIGSVRMRNVISGHLSDGSPVYTPALVREIKSGPDYDRLHRRCTNQRRELKRLNAKIHNLTMYLQARTRSIVDGEKPAIAAEYHHRSNELKRQLDRANETIERLRDEAKSLGCRAAAESAAASLATGGR